METTAGETVPGIYPGRFPDCAPLRRDGARACALSQARAHDGWQAFRAQGLNFPRAAVVAFAYEVQVSLLATNRYLTILPESVLRFPSPHQRIKMLPVELPLRRMPIGIITVRGRTLSPTAQLFIETAREVAKPLAARKA